MKDSLEVVPASKLLDRIRDGLSSLLDARPVDEFEVGHLSGVMNIPLSQLEIKLHELDKAKEIVAY